MAESSDSQPGFFSRLKQHHLYRVAAWYGASIAVLIQIVARAFPYFGWSVAVPAVIIILIAGFPVALVLAWLLAKPTDPAAQTVWQRHHWKLGAIVVPLVIAAVVVSSIFAFRLSARHEARVAAEHAAAQAVTQLTAFNPPADTLVVLPFTNLSDDSKQQYFSDGITEELTNALGQNAALTVIAWDTASHYRNSSETPAVIGRVLNVANLLHGSIEREGDQIRVIAELVDTRTGKQLWSAHYDDSLANVFQVQDKITAAISDAMKVKFASMSPARTINPQAHDLVLQARALMDKAHTAEPFEQARKLLDEAIALDPDYADAHAMKARVWFELTLYSTLPLADALSNMRTEADKALALDPRNVLALVDLGNADTMQGRLNKANGEFERALEIDPSNVYAHESYGYNLPINPALAQELEAVQLDPDNAAAQYNLAWAFIELGQYQQALAPELAMLRLAPHSADNAVLLALTYALMNRHEDAVKAFDLVQPDTPLAKAVVAAGRLTYQSLLDPKLRPQALAAVQALRRRSDFDPLSLYDAVVLNLALGENNTALDLLPQFCARLPADCSDLNTNPLYPALRGDPRFKVLEKQYKQTTRPEGSASASSTSD